jgi:hypothetical protein
VSVRIPDDDRADTRTRDAAEVEFRRPERGLAHSRAIGPPRKSGSTS